MTLTSLSKCANPFGTPHGEDKSSIGLLCQMKTRFSEMNACKKIMSLKYMSVPN